MMFKTAILLGVLTGIFLAVGYMIAGQTGLLFALIFSAFTNFISYYYSDSIILSIYGAKELTPQEAPTLFNIVKKLTQRANLPMPRLYIIDMDQPNAFATGRDEHHSAVVVTTGLLRLLNEDEIMGVLAHELSHIKNRDILIATIAATIAGAISALVNIFQFSLIFGIGQDRERNSNPIVALLLIIITPIIASIIQFAISRSREFAADATGAHICGCPLSLAKALKKIHDYIERVPVEVNQGTAALFIENPMGSIGQLFSTHPPTEERIKRLVEIAKEMGQI
ncbi:MULTISPECIES: zinc metalloprotease HtpX [unclassified Hydrogenobaculum]|uniref:zinc metalloprotease HtpX n=1 Tax=unclassified Hydrogenobaculum TaxID=2622382 RepID=UPI0001C51ED5|nr:MULTISPECIES: zinc metalloprotease HtpX [unclassified Hydrogenobaculum]AEF19871.1 peptidase M48 Ste24p [Hydrogenobaculum sp. 3684]AEG47157.1 protease htpX [Hydrogenobaculum sp. SHO]AGG15805.1 peptidase M48 Ste24p [Hydrogenobaculum sp. HO]AGH94105.1 Zn-dependent protease with chaperone function [Hydrogenobaculum sp. SN]